MHSPAGERARIIGFAGWSGAGKTTLIVNLIPVLRARGLAVSTLKHAHHGFDIDRPGKDSYQHREAGAHEVLIASSRRWALLHELRDAPEPSLADLLARLSPVDLIIVEGFKASPYPKIEVFREANGKPPLFPGDPYIRAIAADGDVPATALPVLPLGDVEAVADMALSCAETLASAMPRLAAFERA